MRDGISEKTDKKSKKSKHHKKADSDEAPAAINNQVKAFMFSKLKERSKSLVTKM